MPEPYKMHVRLGDREFNAEGPEAAVREDFRLFLGAHHEAPKSDPRGASDSSGSGGSSDEKLMGVVFSDRDGYLTLLRRPSGDKVLADATFALLYGYSVLRAEPNVKASALLKGLNLSGITATRLDREADLEQGAGLVMSSGVRRGKVYSLTNAGKDRGAEVVKALA